MSSVSFRSLFKLADENSSASFPRSTNASRRKSAGELHTPQKESDSCLIICKDDSAILREEIVQLHIPANIKDWKSKKINTKRKSFDDESTISIPKLRKLFACEYSDDYPECEYEPQNLYSADVVKVIDAPECVMNLSWDSAVEWDKAEISVHSIGVPDVSEALVRPGHRSSTSQQATKAYPISNCSVKESHLDDEITADFVIESAAVLPLSKAEKELVQLKEKRDRIGKLYGNLDSMQSLTNQIKSKEAFVAEEKGKNLKSRKVVILEHALFASQNRNYKGDTPELLQFHRPRLDSCIKTSVWEISFPKSSRLSHANAENISLVDGEFIVLEYIEESPPILINPGMASYLMNYYRAPEDQPLSSGAPAVAVSAELEHLGSVQRKTHRVPTHLRRLLQLECNSIPDRVVPKIAKLPLGRLEILRDNDETPFILGSLSPGESLTAMCSNLSCAPAFRQSCINNDFLLVRVSSSSKKDKINRFILREINHVYTCGQIQPTQKVPKPCRKLGKDLEGWVQMHISRLLNTLSVRNTGVDFKTVKQFVKRIWKIGDSLSDLHLKRILNTIADEDDLGNWHLHTDPQELEALVSPDFVCLQESSLSNELKLAIDGIHTIELPKLELWLLRMVKILKTYEDRHFDLMRASSLAQDLETRFKLRKLCLIIDRRLKAIERKVQMGKYIFCRLANASWNTTDAFIDSIGNTNLEIDYKVVDPSGGRGEAFSYIKKNRVVKRSQKKWERENTFGIESGPWDLRKMHKDQQESLLMELGHNPRDFAHLGKYDMAAVIAEDCRRATLMGVKNEVFQKLARDPKISSYLRKVEYDEACDKIWRRQISVLSRQEVPRSSDRESAILGVENEDSDSDDKGGINSIENWKISSDRDIDGEAVSLFDAEAVSEREDFLTLKGILSNPEEGLILSPNVAQSLALDPSSLLRASEGKSKKALKTVRRYIGEDGIECIQISFAIISQMRE